MEPIGQVPSSLTALMKEFRTITNNMANAGTVGFKRTVNSFAKQLMQSQEAAGNAGENPENRGIVINKGQLDFSQGILTATGRNLDLAISGQGWFTIETKDGKLFTRNGSFMTNTNGQLVDGEGNILAGKDGPIIIPPSAGVEDLVISSTGAVMSGNTKFGEIDIVTFDDPYSLKPVGGCLFQAPADVLPKPAESAQVNQGYLESSNVNATEELVDLIKVSRLYEANMKLMNRRSDTSKAILEVAGSV